MMLAYRIDEMIIRLETELENLRALRYAVRDLEIERDSLSDLLEDRDKELEKLEQEVLICQQATNTSPSE